MAYINIYKLERFYYNAVMAGIKKCKSLKEIQEKFGPDGLTVEEVFTDALKEEEAGKRFEYNIRGFIVRKAKKYNTIYHQARKRAFIDFITTFRTKKELPFKFSEAWKETKRNKIY